MIMYRVKTVAFLGTLTMIFLILSNSLLSEQSESEVQDDVQKVQDAIEVLSARGKTLKGMKLLEDLPSDIVIPSLVEALQERSELSEGAKRQRAFQLLKHHSAWRYENGFKLLVSGLNEPLVAKTCVLAIQESDETLRTDATRVLLNYLERITGDKNIDMSFKSYALRAIGRLGDDTEDNQKRVAAIFQSPEINSDLRVLAGSAYLEMVGVEKFLEELDISDSVSVMSALYALGRLSSKTKGTLKSNELNRQHAASIVIASLNSKTQSLREYALNSGINVIANWTQYLESPLSKTYSDSLSHSLKMISENDPDPLLRNKGMQVLENINSLEKKEKN